MIVLPLKHVVYLLLTNTSLCKIGYSSELPVRFKALKGENPGIGLRVGHVIPIEGGNLEWMLLCYFSPKRVRGEWFNLTNWDVRRIRKIKRYVSRNDLPKWLDDTHFHRDFDFYGYPRAVGEARRILNRMKKLFPHFGLLASP